MNEKVQVLSELRLPVCTYMSCRFAVKINYLPAHLKDTHNYEHDDDAGLRVMNDTAASRNVFLCDGQLLLTSFYSKTRSLNDGTCKPIARFPDSVTQAYFLVYLLIVRPLEYCIVKSLHEVGGGGCGEAEDQRIFLFARRGEALSAKVLCTWFKETLADA
jgi:hypothetical protein